MKKIFFPFFDSLEHLESTGYKILEDIILNKEDLKHGISFLKSYKGSLGTFNSYRREVERLFQWCFLIAGKSIVELKRHDIEEFIKFCMNPPKSWIGIKKTPRFMDIEGKRVPNPEWKPFVATVSKTAHQQGERPSPKEFELSHTSIKETFAILSTFYNYLCQEEYALMNPVALIRQKSKFIRRTQGHPKIRRLSETQWHYVMTLLRKSSRWCILHSI